jgi:hypothetical protein
MPLNVWTKPTGWNFGQEPGTNLSVASGSFIVGYQYVIQTVGTTNFKKIGAPLNSAGIIFTATSTGLEAGPDITNPSTNLTYTSPGSGVASRVAFSERQPLTLDLPVQNDNVKTLLINNAGTGYPTNGGSFFTTGGSGTGMTVQVFSPSGYLQAVSINNPGVGYRDGDIITILAGGNNATVIFKIEFLVTYSIISGKLPPGLRLTENKIVGSAFEVPRLTDFNFCIRASKDGQISDRTFTISIEGEDQPEFITPGGLLDIGANNELFVIDSSYVDYQIEVLDFDTTAGQKLSYFIANGDGQLPPGLILTTDGRIVGFVQPALAIKPEDGDGTYANSFYDAVAYDFAFLPTNGYDSYIYDSVFFDFALQSNKPKKLNRTYEFIVTVTDGDTYANRTYKIFVVGDDYFRADNTTWLTSDSLFTTDVTYLRPPTWLTSSYLGLYRANNFVTLILDTYDSENVIYSLEQINADSLAISKRRLESDNTSGGFSLTTTLTTTAPTIGHFLSFAGIIPGCSIVNRVDSVTSIGENEYRLGLHFPLETNVPDGVKFLIGTMSELPPGMAFDENNSEIFGLVPYQPAITKTYKFTITASKLDDKGERASSPKIFTVDLLGEVDSILKWDTSENLGSINANFVSTLSVKANSNIENNTVLYTLSSGSLPPGLTLDLDGEIIGKVNQYASLNGPGLTTFDFTTDSTTFDGDSLTVDRIYEFTVIARDQYGYSAISRTFRISVDTPNQLVYSNIRVKPFLKTEQRNLWREFINNASVFSPLSIYRPNDPNFGIQTELSMIVFAGIETKEAATYISAIGLNHKRKRFHFGEVKKAVAIIPGSQTSVYEVIYVEMLDPLEPNGKRLPNKIENLSKSSKNITVDASNSIWSRQLSDLSLDEPYLERPDQIISVDSQGYNVSSPQSTAYFPNSISNWRERLENWSNNGEHFEVERNYLPLWMRSIQPGSKEEINFKLAVPLCYCKVGTADDILLNIKNYIKNNDFSFNLLDYTADRYIIDAVEGQTADKYLVFRNDRITI